MNVAAASALELELEAGWFDGGAAVGEVMPFERDGRWTSLELSWKR